MKLKIKDLKTEDGYVKNVNIYYRDELVGSIYKESDCEIRVNIGCSDYSTCSNYSLDVFINQIIDFCGLDIDIKKKLKMSDKKIIRDKIEECIDEYCIYDQVININTRTDKALCHTIDLEHIYKDEYSEKGYSTSKSNIKIFTDLNESQDEVINSVKENISILNRKNKDHSVVIYDISCEEYNIKDRSL